MAHTIVNLAVSCTVYHQIAYGHEGLTPETRDAFLYGQLLSGLKLTLMENPAVYESLTYKQLCCSLVERKEADGIKVAQVKSTGA